MRRHSAALGFVLLFLLGSPLLVAQSPADSPPAPAARANPLPVRRVVLYKTGVGYFEHRGPVHGSDLVTITFTSAQLDDVLKSLTTLDLGGGRITSVSYNSDTPLEQQLGALRLPLGDETTIAKFYEALRGARLEARSDGAVVASGRLLSVETRTVGRGDQASRADWLSIVSDSGEVRTVELTPRVSVRLLERPLNDQVSRYLGALASTRAEDTRRMVIATSGAGDRELFVSYISEVPVWKTTYRVVLPSSPDRKPFLQGWAIVDNTVGEDWDQVELSLVAGAPQSFIQTLSQPYYAERPVVPLPENARLVPQTHAAGQPQGATGEIAGTVMDSSGGTMPGVTVRVLDARGFSVGQAVTQGDGSYATGGLPPGRYVVEFALQGFITLRQPGVEVVAGRRSTANARLTVGGVAEAVTVTAESPVIDTRTTAAVEEEMAEVESAAEGRDLGDVFEYAIKEPITIRKNQSALVPIANTEIGVERVSLWNPDAGNAQPLRALWITNTSPLTLDGGTMTVLDRETFVGEGLIEQLPPGARRLVSYASDLAVHVSRRRQPERTRMTRVLVRDGKLTLFGEETTRSTYTVRNDDASARVVIIEHPREGHRALVKGGPEPTETTADAYRFRVSVDPHATATLVVADARESDADFGLEQMSDVQMSTWASSSWLTAEVRKALEPILAKRAEILKLTTDIAARQAEVTRITNDQQRIRENMKALKGSAAEQALLERYTRQLGAQEDRIEVMRREAAQLETQRGARSVEMNALVSALSLDVTLGG